MQATQSHGRMDRLKDRARELRANARDLRTARERARQTAPTTRGRRPASATPRGPTTTVEGKSRSARNALKHGLRAQKLVLLADEEMAEFQALEEELRAELAPEGVLQNILVARIAVAAWRMHRADRMEVDLLDRHLGLHPLGEPARLGLALVRDRHGPRAFDTLLRYRGTVQTKFWRLLRALSALKAGAPVPIERARGAALPSPARGSRPAEPGPSPGCPSPSGSERACGSNEAGRRRNVH